MRLCPRCKTEFLDGTLELCPFDDYAIVSAEDYYEAEGDPMLGATVAGRFRIVGRVGVGAMGTVYRAVQASVERLVALKILRPDLTKDEDTVARFHREAHATSALSHPNTVTLYDFGQSPEGYLFIAMELLEGRLLGNMLKEDGALPVELAVKIVTQVSRSLAEAHRKGIVHRDLKPDNIMLAEVEGQDVVKVLDFGIAKIVRGDKRIDALETQAGTVFGTPRYMSPEQAQSKPLDARSDLYSLGIILYQMITGHAPFEDADAVVVMARHIKTKPRRPTDVRPDLPISTRLERLIMRMVEKDRTKRPQSSEELIDALAAINYAATEDDFSLLTPRPHRKRNRLVPIAAGLAALVVLAAGAVIALAVTRGGEGGYRPPPIDAPVVTSIPDGATKTLPVAPSPQMPEVEMFLDSEPRGADVFRDGELLGTAPLTVMEPEGAAIHFAFELEGHQTTTRIITISESESRLIVELPEVTAPGSTPTKRGSQRPRPPRGGTSPSATGSKVSSPTGPTTPGQTGPEDKTKTGGSPYSRWDNQ